MCFHRQILLFSAEEKEAARCGDGRRAKRKNSRSVNEHTLSPSVHVKSGEENSAFVFGSVKQEI